LPDHLKHRHKKCPRDDHLKAGSSGFRMYTVHASILLGYYDLVQLRCARQFRRGV
jgi:hypothetical protein